MDATNPGKAPKALVRSRFQVFEDEAEPEKAGERLAALRERLRELELTALIVPRADAFQNEYLPPSEERLAWLTGFTGSAGLLIVFAEEGQRAALFVDGRYTLQAARQVDGEAVEVVPIAEHRPAAWLAERLEAGHVAGVNPWLLTHEAARRYRDALEKAGAGLRFVLPDPVEEIWQDRPAPPDAEVFAHPLRYAGRSVAEKLEEVRATLAEKQVDAALITATDSASWLFNIRSRAIVHNPVVLGMALVPTDAQVRVRLFVRGGGFAPDARAQVEELADILPFEALEEVLASRELAGRRVLVDARSAAARLFALLEQAGAEVVEGEDPCLWPKACKNKVEQAGMRAAHVRDGVAVSRFLAWLEEAAACGEVDEIGAVAKLEELRIDTAEKMGEPLFDISFDTISGAGPNGAIVHYRVTTASNRVLKPGELYLVDSGGQYMDGTTDITRTVFIGPPEMQPAAEQKRHFTLVLKGMIALSRARFPAGTQGRNLDVLARQYLWAAGLDYDHGTGHGVGYFLNVHEGPQSISLRGAAALKPGMITSNEPGYYLEDHYGIRIENLILCTQAEAPEGGEREMLGFETITLAPIDRRLIDVSMLDETELAWLNDYHAQVLRTLLEPLRGLGVEAALCWLKRACMPLGEGRDANVA